MPRPISDKPFSVRHDFARALGKALRNVFWFTVTITAFLVAAYIILRLADQDSVSFVAFAIVVVLTLWGYRVRWITQTDSPGTSATMWRKKYAGKTKRRTSELVSAGPFAPANPLSSIPQNMYFINLAHSDYLPHIGFPESEEGNGCFDLAFQIPAALLAILIFAATWWLIDQLMLMLIGQSFQWAMLCLVLPAAIFVLSWSSMVGEGVDEWRCTRQIKSHGIPLAGSILTSIKKFTTDKQGGKHHHIELEYVFTTPEGRQRIGAMNFRDDGGDPPQPGTPLVIIYADDDCHMPL